MKDLILRQLQEAIATKTRLMERCAGEIERAGLIVAGAMGQGHKALFCGNGGSAADAQHIAAELVIRYRSGHERRSLPAISLSADSSVLTAGGNDYGYDQVFARQVEGLGQSGDVLIGITTSGNSENILRAISVAKAKGMKTVLLTGGNGGRIAEQCADDLDAIVCVPSDVTARIQEAHILIGHIICAIVERELFGLED